MAHQPDSNVIETVVQLLCESGLSQMAEAVRIMLNEAMKIERPQTIGADPYQRSECRQGYANGFKAEDHRDAARLSCGIMHKWPRQTRPIFLESPRYRASGRGSRVFVGTGSRFGMCWTCSPLE